MSVSQRRTLRQRRADAKRGKAGEIRAERSGERGIKISADLGINWAGAVDGSSGYEGCKPRRARDMRVIGEKSRSTERQREYKNGVEAE